MSNTPWTPVVKIVRDVTDPVSASTVNSILNDYTNRTQHLYEAFAGVDDKSVLIAFDQISVGVGVAQYSVVYHDYNTPSPGLKLASPALTSSTYASTFKASNSSFVFGIVKTTVPSVDPKSVDVYISGLVQETGIVTALLDSSADNTGFTGGPLFLSAFTPGKLTSVPGGLAFFVGYAKNLNEFHLSPSFESFNDFFYNFKYTLLDRPGRTPVFDGTNWTVPSTGDHNVGWVAATDVTSGNRPTGNQSGALFFYNIPSDAFIDADTGLTTQEKSDAKALRRSLPPNPTVFSFLTVNGVVQGQKDNSGDIANGIYFINNFGIWWYANTAHTQPWADDVLKSVSFTSAAVNASTDVITLANHGFVANTTILEFFTVTGTAGTLPSGLSGATYANGVFTGGGTTFKVLSTPDANTFTLVDPNNPGTDPVVNRLNITDVGSDTLFIKWQPNMWLYGKGSEYLRPKTTLQFTKINPNIKTAIVTSIKPAIDSSNILSFSDYAGADASAGDLFAHFNLKMAATVEGTPSKSAIKAISYDNQNPGGMLNVVTGPVITSVVGNGLVTALTDANGGCTITVDNTSASNLITSMEVEQGRLEYTGLHSYILVPWAILPAGYVGKFILPSKLPTLPLQFQMLLFGKSSAVNPKYRLKFKFEYVVTKPGLLLSTALTESKTFEYVFTTGYTANNTLLVTPPEFVIPRQNLIENGLVNFRLNRLKPSGPDQAGNYYDGDMGLVGTYWSFLPPN